MCRIVILVLVLSVVMPVFAGIINSNRAYNYNSYYPNRTSINSLNNRRYRPISTRNKYYHEPRIGNMDALERYAFKKKYPRESNLSRLERLENLAFGATQTGDYATRFKNVEAAILSQPQPQKKSFLSNLSDYFSGQATGFTPSITDTMMNRIITPSYVTPGSVPYFSPTMNSMMPMGGSSFSTPGYTTQGFQQYSSPWGKGYRTFGHDYGTGSSIRMLD